MAYDTTQLQLGLRSSSRTNGTYGKWGMDVGPRDMATVPSKIDWPLIIGHVKNVQPQLYMCNVLSDDGRNIPNVSWASPVFSAGTGSGMYAVPEEDARVLVGKFFNGIWYIVGYIPQIADYEGNQSVNGRRDLQHGDMAMSTTGGALLEMKNNAEYIKLKTGAMEILMETASNRINMFSHRFRILNKAGFIDMTADPNGYTKTTMFFRKKIDDPNNFVKIEMGHLGQRSDRAYGATQDDPPPEIIFHCDICNKIRITADTEGELKIYAHRIRILAEETIYTGCNGSIVDGAVSMIDHRKKEVEILDHPMDFEFEEMSKQIPGDVGSQLSSPPATATPPPRPLAGKYKAAAESSIDPAELNTPAPVTGTAPVNCQTLAEGVTRRGIKYKDGKITLRDKDGNVLGTYAYRNGGGTNEPPQGHAIPAGSYTVYRGEESDEPDFSVTENGDTFGYKFYIPDFYQEDLGRERKYIRIHPDAGWPGTNGCIGIKGGPAVQRQFYAHMSQVLRENGGKCTLDFN